MLQTVKGGYSETRIEKRIIITGDDDVDQEQVRTHMQVVGQIKEIYVYELKYGEFKGSGTSGKFDSSNSIFSQQSNSQIYFCK